MMKSYNSDGVAKPGGAYTHVYEVPAGMRMIVLSGQVGIKPDGSLAQGFEAQCEQTYANILTHLKQAGVGKDAIFKFNVFLTRATDIPVYREVRKRMVGDDCKPTSTLLVISALAHPDMLVEIEAFAAA